MITWGINALNHDASIAVVKDGELVSWRRAQNYTGIRADQFLNSDIISDSLGLGGPDEIVWYERPWLKKTRQLYAGQYNWAFDMDELPKRYLNKVYSFPYAKIRYLPHHLSHAAAGHLTSPFEKSTVIVLDAIGEWESASIWLAQGTDLKKVWSRSYPTSLGLFYSAFTHLLGFTPVAEEHLLQQLAEQGDAKRYYLKVGRYWKSNWKLSSNLHKGVENWGPVRDEDRADIAAAVQVIFEEQVTKVMSIAKEFAWSDNLVYMGGCAMNSKYNTQLPDKWEGLWSLPIPGDSSSAIGAALYQQKAKIKWPYGLANSFPLKYNKA